jgi:UDP-N-acetylglucosamine 2-epimerase
LERESVLGEIHLTGDTMYDVFLKFKDKADRSDILERLELSDEEYGLLTLHRAENVDDPARLRSILKGILKTNMKVIFPIHPRTANRLKEYNISLEHSNIRIIEPLSYIEMLKLLKHAKLVLTDSGGLQKEAFWSQTPCITLRESTEWTETVEASVNQIVGADSEKIAQAIRTVEEKYDEIKKKFTGNPFGDGYAARRIVKIIESFTHIK